MALFVQDRAPVALLTRTAVDYESIVYLRIFVPIRYLYAGQGSVVLQSLSCKQPCVGFVAVTARSANPPMGVRTLSYQITVYVGNFGGSLPSPGGTPLPPLITCYLTHGAVAMSLPFCPCARLAVL